MTERNEMRGMFMCSSESESKLGEGRESLQMSVAVMYDQSMEKRK